jgi:deaminated glutathione amidase
MKIALIQMNTQDDTDSNIRIAEKYVRDAAAGKASFICLPENAFFMSAPNSPLPVFPEMNAHAGLIRMQELARELKLWISIGSIAVASGEGKKGFNRSVLINDKGEVAATYDKIHLFDVTLPTGEIHLESAKFEHGDKAVTCKTSFAMLGLSICYDVRFPHLYRALAKQGAEILLVPAAFTQTTGAMHWHTLLRARAIETGCFVLAAAQTGTHAGGRKTYGHSLVIDPWGTIIAEKSDDTGVLFADLDLDKVEKTRNAIPALQHDQNFK